MRALTLLLACALHPALAQGQAPDGDARLRDALRRATQELRAAQDAQAATAATLATVTQERDAARAALAAAPPTAAAAPKPAIAATAQAVQDLQRRNAGLAGSLAHAQQAQRQSAETASALGAKAEAAERNATRMQGLAGACQATSQDAARIATEVVDLYQDRHFRTLLILSDEPILGLKRVELENLLQDYEDKLRSNTVRSTAP